MSETQPTAVTDPAAFGVSSDIAHRLNAFAGISFETIADCLGGGDSFEYEEKFSEALPGTGIQPPEELFTTLNVKYRANWVGNGVTQAYEFSLGYGSEYDLPVYTNKYVLLRRGTREIILYTLLDVEFSDSKPALRPAMAEEINELKKEIERLQNLPSDGTNVLVPS